MWWNLKKNCGISDEYFLGDALGSVRQMTDASGEITFARGYDPYGVVTYTSGTSQTEFGFTGEQYGDSTQLLYLRARHYSPADGRFTSRDTWSGDVNSPMSFNLWNYGYSNPIKHTDPSGHCPQPPDESDQCWQLLLQIETQYTFINLQTDLSRNNYWTYDELLNIQSDLERLDRASKVDLTTLYPDDVKIKRVRSDTYFGQVICGGTPTFFTKGRSISIFNKWGQGCLVHELAHYLDSANMHLAKPFEKYVGASTFLWFWYDPGPESPPIYNPNRNGGKPPNRHEDFAESLTEYVLLYTNYTGKDIGIIPGEKRWYFIESILDTGKIPTTDKSAECIPGLGSFAFLVSYTGGRP